MLQAHRRLMVHRYKEQAEKHALLNEHFITSSEELYQSITSIDKKSV